MTSRLDAGAPIFRLAEHCPAFTVAVRNREFLAGSASDSFPEHIPDVGEMIPTLSAEHGDFSPPTLVAAAREAIDVTLPQAGGVLLRGLALTDRASFERFMVDLGYDRTGYEGGIAVRKNDAGVSLNASQEDHRVTLSPHNEMAYLPTYPRKIFFFCEIAAARGGEVPVNDIRQTIRIIPPGVQDTFRARRIRYHRNLPRVSTSAEMGWVDTFITEDRGVVEQHMIDSGYEFRWRSDGGLQYQYARDAFVAHPDGREELWFNQVTELHCSYWRSHPHFRSDLPPQDYPATTTYGDGSAIDEDLISFLRGALWQTARAVRMQAADVLVLDNQVLQHGRLSFEGPRRHFVSLTR